MTEQAKARRIAVILAGGGGRRMGGADKGALTLGGRRLFDHVHDRLAPQADRVLISGSHDYGAGLPVFADRDDGPLGPAAGLWAALHWIDAHAPQTESFFSAPVDGPFLPLDLVARLGGRKVSAIAADANGLHPAFGCWRVDALRAALSAAPDGYGLPMKKLAESIHAEHVMFDDPGAFENINTSQDLARAEARLRA